MYTNFRIQNFRGFKDLELKDLARVNLIAGKNNVGKTSLLEAILAHTGVHNILLARIPRTAVSIISSSSDTRDETFSKYEWDILFHKMNNETPISFFGHIPTPHQRSLFELLGDTTVSPFHLDISTEFANKTQIAKQILWARGTEIQEREVQGLLFTRGGHEHDFIPSFANIGKFYVRPSQRSVNAAFLFQNIPLTRNVNEIRLSYLKLGRQESLLINTLQIIEPKLSNLELLENGIYGDLTNMPQLMPISSMGDGMNRIISIILATSDAKDGVLVIDEIENGLHYSVQTDVWRAIAEAAKQFNVQIFATTHSREMIQAAYEAFRETPEDDFRFHRLDRDRMTGDIYPTTYDQYSIEAAMDVNAEVR